MAQQTVDDGNGHEVPLRLYVERIFEEREKALGPSLRRVGPAPTKAGRRAILEERYRAVKRLFAAAPVVATDSSSSCY